jgi:phosphoribosylformylglycinamidine synthase PurS subunit
LNFHATVYVSLKKGYSDPEGETTASALQGLGYNVTQVRSSKAYEVSFEAESREAAEATRTRCAAGSSPTPRRTTTASS